jgi:hypothetical protein
MARTCAHTVLAITFSPLCPPILAVLLVLLLARERRPAVLASVAARAIAGPVAWNAILRATHANHSSPTPSSPFFPISWQDTGSGLFTPVGADNYIHGS